MKLSLVDGVCASNDTRHRYAPFGPPSALRLEHALPHFKREVARKAVLFQFGTHPSKSIQLSRKYLPVNGNHAGFVRSGSDTDDLLKLHDVCVFPSRSVKCSDILYPSTSPP